MNILKNGPLYFHCYCHHPCTLFWGHTANKEACAKIQQATGPHEDLTIVKRGKLQWYGHVSRSSGLAKTILLGTVKGGRRQGRQKKRWEDNFREWTNGQAWSSACPRGQWRTGRNGGNWLRNHMWCSNDPRGEGVDEVMRDHHHTDHVYNAAFLWNNHDAITCS